jgi:hypothetical protein
MALVTVRTDVTLQREKGNMARVWVRKNVTLLR